MTVEILTLLIIIGVSTILFITEVFSVDKTAFLVLIALLVTNIVTPTESISGFSNSAVITIMCLMIISAALEYNRSVYLIAQLMMPMAGLHLLLAIPIIMLFIGTFSAFISTTAVVIIFVKIMPVFVKKHNLQLRNYMMPISFAGILGGSCTLMGTSTNLIVHQVAISSGLPGFSFFEFTAVGAILMVSGIIVVTLMVFLYLNRKKHVDKPIYSHNASTYITELKLTDKSSAVGKRFIDTPFYKNDETSVLQIKRGNSIIKNPTFWQKFRANDILVLRTNMESLLKFKESNKVQLLGEENIPEDPKKESGRIVELIMLPGSKLLGKSFSQLSTYELNGAQPIALKKHKTIINRTDEFIKSRLSRARIDVGDRLVLELDPTNADSWDLEDNVEILDNILQPIPKGNQKYLSLIILGLVIVLAASGVFSILKSSLLGVGLLILTRSISLEKAYKSINWQIIFLLVGLFPLGIAMKNTGGDIYISQFLQGFIEGRSPAFVMAAIFFITMLISSVLSNNATAIILTPIVISIAVNIGANPLPFLIAVAMGSNFSFFTPIGYQTNTIVYGMGIYKFRDFVIVGGLLSITLWMLASWLIPLFFKF